MKRWYTKETLKKKLRSLSIKEGMVVLVQADLDAFDEIIGGAQALIETLMEIVGKAGCIIVPTFTESCFDPASYECADISYENWDAYRINQYGYDPKLTMCSKYRLFSEQFLKNEGVRRTNHPIYSFAFWGNYDELCIDDSLDFPISFGHILKEFVSKEAVNLLIGVNKKDGLLLKAIAKMIDQGILVNRKAIIRKNHKNSMKSFLDLMMDEESIENCLSLCSIHTQDHIVSLSLATSEDSK